MGLYSDAKAIAKRDPAAKSTAQVILLYSGFHALFFHRIAHWFYRHRRFFIARTISQISRFFTGVEIHPGARVGSGLFIDHGMGIVIGETAEIGDNCTIYHGVTLGGTGKDRGKRHPTIGDNVLIGAGAKILGPFRVGSCSMVGANAVVLNEIPPYSTVVGVPGRIVRQKKQIPHNIELDHGNSPDPIEQEICRLLHRVKVMERELGIEPVYKPGDKFSRDCSEPDMKTPNKNAERQATRERSINKVRSGGRKNENL